MNIALLCATKRGYRLLEKLNQLHPEHQLFVFSFRETAWEPPFLDDIATLARKIDAIFFEGRQVGHTRFQSFWDNTPLDLMLVVNWRYLIPSELYERPRLGAFVFHDSLLPAYRGFSPTVWAMINGEDHTGVTLFEMVEEVDAGDIVAQKQLRIEQDDTIATVTERVTATYLQVLEENIDALLENRAEKLPQAHDEATFTCKRLPEDNRIDWTQSTQDIYNLVRAVTKPYTGAYTTLNGEKLIVWEAEMLPQSNYVGRVPGRVTSFRNGEGVTVLTGDGELRLITVQLEGKPVQPAEQVINRLSYTLGREV